MSAFNAWVMLKGLETLGLRMHAHATNAHHLAEQSSLETVYYCGLPDHPGYTLAIPQQPGFGGVLA
jgi:O-succinylhomoserine sulfhydrylase